MESNEKFDLETIKLIKKTIVQSELKEPSEFNEKDAKLVREKRIDDLERETIDFDKENLINEVKAVVANLPYDASPKEKVRIIYRKLGELFCYDYRVVDDLAYAYEKRLDSSYVSRYETCVQISKILDWALNQIDGVTSKTISRNPESIRGLYGEDHFANDVTIEEDGFSERYLLDLTLDLYLIQANAKTKHFGFETLPYEDFDIFPEFETKKIDMKYGLIEQDEYMDDVISKTGEELEKTISIDATDREKIEQKLIAIGSIMPSFNGYHEAMRFIKKVFDEILKIKYKEYNLYYQRQNMDAMKTCYKIMAPTYTKWVVYSSSLRMFIAIDAEMLDSMLLNGWKTNSNTLAYDIFDDTHKSFQ